MFSRRTAWSASENRLAEAAARRVASGVRLLDLTDSNPTHVGLGLSAEELGPLLAHPRSARYEPAPLGAPAAREAVAHYCAERGAPVSPERVVLSASTSESYAWLFKLLADPGDAVLVPEPSYPLFEYLARLESVEIVSYPLRYDGEWHVDFGALRAAITPQCRAIVVVHPNNPTGSFLKRDELESLAALCREHDLGLVGDEVFADYAFGPDARRAASVVGAEAPVCFALGGLSKALAQPQLKIGWIAVGGEKARAAEAMARLEIVADTYLSANGPAQAAVPELLAAAGRVQGRIRARMLENLATLKAAFHPGASWQPLKVEGGWSAVLRLPQARTSEEWALALLEQDAVLVHPGFFFDFPSEAYLVLSLIVEPAVFAEGVRRIAGRVG